MTARRNFLKGVGIAGAFVAGVAAYKQVKEIADENKDISHLAPPIGAATLQLTGSYGQVPKPVPVSSPFVSSTYYVSGLTSETTNKVSMTVGKDNRLWIFVGDEWHRVALEG